MAAQPISHQEPKSALPVISTKVAKSVLPDDAATDATSPAMKAPKAANTR